MDNLNELEKSTYASYKTKSSADFDRASKQDDTKRMYKRGKGLLRATGREMDISHQEYLAKKKQNEEANMDNNIYENIIDMIDAIETGNSFDAEKMFDQIMMTKIDNALSQKKNEVAYSMFNTEECEDCEEEIEEANAINKAKKNEYVKKVGQSAKPLAKADTSNSTQAGRNTMRPQPSDSKDSMRSYKKSPSDFWKKKGIGTGVHKEEVEQTNEALKGGQHKIDMNKNDKLDAHDFKLLRKKKKGVSEAAISAGKRPMDPAAAKAAYQAEKKRREMQQTAKPQTPAVAPAPKAKKVRSPEEEKARMLAKADMKAMRKSNG